MKTIVANENVCISCRLCEIHCIVQHSKSKGLIKVYKKEKKRPLARIRVEEKESTSFGLQCRHCEEPLCVYSCISGAMYKDENGVVKHDSKKCVGCWTCILVCPYGAIERDENEKKVASKCDFCEGADQPACVANCPNEALKLVERN